MSSGKDEEIMSQSALQECFHQISEDVLKLTEILVEKPFYLHAFRMRVEILRVSVETYEAVLKAEEERRRLRRNTEGTDDLLEAQSKPAPAGMPDTSDSCPSAGLS